MWWVKIELGLLLLGVIASFAPAINEDESCDERRGDDRKRGGRWRGSEQFGDPTFSRDDDYEDSARSYWQDEQ